MEDDAVIGKSIDLDEKILRKNRIPLLFEDPSWKKLFGDTEDKKIQQSKEELMELVSKNREMEKSMRKLQKDKLEAMKMILGVSDSVNNENKTENIGLLDEYKERVLDINEELEEITFQLETIPKEIRDANFQLLNLTVQHGYDELKRKEKGLEKASAELDALRARLQELIVIKYDYEEWINETYIFLHGLLGNEMIEKLDRERLK